MLILTVMIFATPNVNISLCAHSVMKSVTFGTSETLVMLLVPSFYLTMLLQYFLLLLWLFGVSNVIIMCDII